MKIDFRDEREVIQGPPGTHVLVRPGAKQGKWKLMPVNQHLTADELTEYAESLRLCAFDAHSQDQDVEDDIYFDEPGGGREQMEKDTHPGGEEAWEAGIIPDENDTVGWR